MNQPGERNHYIDWVRVFAFFVLIFFHCAMPFVIFNWEVKNAETSMGLSRIIWWIHQWRLPLLFFISGVGIHFSLRKRAVLVFARERVVRLLIPLLFAMFFTIPLQVYFEKLQRGKITGSYAHFYSSVWDFLPYPEGSLTWSHMWFVVYLFVFCMLLLPVFAIFKIRIFNTIKEKISNVFTHPISSVILVIPLIAYYFTLYLPYPEQGSLLDDWFVFIFSITLVWYGYLLGGNTRFWDMCEKYRYYFLAIALLCVINLFYSNWWDMDLPTEKSGSLYWYGVINAMQIWLLILSFLGFAKKYLNFNNRFLKYANQAVYPFYILHQTLIVAFGYYIVQWKYPIFIKLPVLICLCFVPLLVIYNWLIKPFIIPRILFGLKPKEAIK